MKIISISTQKGGAGKSTLALNLAYCFQTSLKVGLVDTDLQGSLTGLNLMVDGINLIPFKDDFSLLTNSSNDIIIIDTPPYLSSKLPELFLLSDFILIPSKAGFFDLMALKSTLKMVNEAKERRSDIKAGIVFNMVKHNSSISTELKGLIEHETIPVMNSVITDRVSYTRSVIDGGVFNTSDEKAKIEVTNLADEILRNIGI
jgi:chromosome partitioning protein